MKSLFLLPTNHLEGRITLPASKSISNRALLINALSQSTALPRNLSDCDDTNVMLRALQDMPEVIDIGAAGTAMRFLTAYLCVTSGTHVITGSERMRHRPIGLLVNALRQLGADIEYVGEEGFPPLRITGRTDLEGGDLSIAGDVSSQYVSALLMVAPTLRRGLHLKLTGNIASRPYLDMTLTMMRDFGAQAAWSAEDAIHVEPIAYTPRPYTVEGDWSAASYWYEMVALAKNHDARIDLVGLHRESIQGDSRVQEMFGLLGVHTEFLTEADGTAVARLTQRGERTGYFQCDLTHQPDLAQTLTSACTLLGVPFRLTGLQSLRIKETDRIAALDKELGKLVQLKTSDSTIEWDGTYTADLEKAASFSLAFDTYDDHRMAMSLAPVCQCIGSGIQINNPQVVSKSYPGFWNDLEKVGFTVKWN